MAQQDVLDLYRDRGLTLDEFQAGDNAELISQLAQLPQAEGFQLIYLWGAAATGKSHLLQGVCATFNAVGQRSVYIPLALAELNPELLSGLESLDLVCLDDIDQRWGDSEWEDALFHLFNRLRERQACLLVSAQTPPRHSDILLPDLKSRLSWGLAYQLLPLPSPLLGEFLRRQAARRGIELSNSVVNYILTHHSRDMAALKSLLDQLDRRSLQQQRRITVPFLKQVLALCAD